MPRRVWFPGAAFCLCAWGIYAKHHGSGSTFLESRNFVMNRPKLLITGPGGRVGTQIVPLLRSHFRLRLADRNPLPIPAGMDDEFVLADIRDFAALQRACEGMDAMLHLAAVSDEADFHSQLLPMNIVGLHNAFEAARLAGIRKVLFASTGQTVLHYPPGQPVGPEMPVRPWTVYACTKVFGEALARYYSDHFGLSMVCIRICWFQGYDSPLLKSQPEMHPKWCSPRDLTQLIVKCIASDIRFGLFFGVSHNAGRYWDISNAQTAVGYQPEDDAAKLFGIQQ